MGGNPVAGNAGSLPGVFIPAGCSPVNAPWGGGIALFPGQLTVGASSNVVPGVVGMSDAGSDEAPVYLPMEMARDPWSVDALMPFADPAVVIAQKREREADASALAYLELPTAEAAMQAMGRAFIEGAAEGARGMLAAGWLRRLVGGGRTEVTPANDPAISPHAELTIGGRTYAIGPDVRRIVVNGKVNEPEMSSTLSIFDERSYPAGLVISRSFAGGAWEIERDGKVLVVEKTRFSRLHESVRWPERRPGQEHHVVVGKRFFEMGKGEFVVSAKGIVAGLKVGLKGPIGTTVSPDSTQARTNNAILDARAQDAWEQEQAAWRSAGEVLQRRAERSVEEGMKAAEAAGTDLWGIVRHNVGILSKVRYALTTIEGMPMQQLGVDAYVDRFGRIVGIVEDSSRDLPLEHALQRRGKIFSVARFGFDGITWRQSPGNRFEPDIQSVIDQTELVLNTMSRR